MAAVAGCFICFAWYYTILAGFYTLYCPVLYLMFVNQRVYRTITDSLFALWELFPVALFQCCWNTKLLHYGDYVKPDEKCIIIMNHRTRVDWNYIWLALYHATDDEVTKYDESKREEKLRKKESVKDTLSHLFDSRTSRTKFVLKDEIKAVPGLGWIMQLNYFLYVKRNWQEDQVSLSCFTEYYHKMDNNYRIVLFPEGTDLSVDNIKKSDRFASANNLPHFDFVLHPRTTGWAVLYSKLKRGGLESIYDVTVAYDNPAQTEADLLNGQLPSLVHFHFKRYSVNELPKEEDALRVWLNERWREKEHSLRAFNNNGTFFEKSSNKAPPLRPAVKSLKLAKMVSIFWIGVNVIFTIAAFTSTLFQFWIIYHSLLFVFVTSKFGGFHELQHKISQYT